MLIIQINYPNVFKTPKHETGSYVMVTLKTDSRHISLAPKIFHFQKDNVHCSYSTFFLVKMILYSEWYNIFTVANFK